MIGMPFAAAVAIAAFFTFGCLAIHALRQHARFLTPSLALVAITLGFFVGLVALTEKPRMKAEADKTQFTPRKVR